MLVKRKLSMDCEVLNESVLRREVFEDFLRAEDLYEHAKRQVEELISTAADRSRQKQDQSLALFWMRANQQLQALENEHAAFQHEALAGVERLLNLALSRILDDTDLTQRIRALMRSLSQCQVARSKAILRCHPEQVVAVQAWLAQSNVTTFWNVEEDIEIPLQALHLVHAHGTFQIDWEGLRRGLLGQSSQQLCTE